MSDKQEPLLPRDVDARAFGYWPFASYNHNVVIACILSVLSPAADAVWQGTVLTTFMFLTYNGSNSMVGFADMGRGIFTLIIALPIGWAADRWPRKSRLIAIGGAIAPVASGLTIYAVSHLSEGDTAGSYAVLVGGLCMWGAVYTIAKGPVQALFANSTRAGERSQFYTLKFQLNNMAAAAGRAGTIGVFAAGGDRWRLVDLRLLIYVGLGLEALSALAMLGFRDSAMLPKELPKELPRETAASTKIGPGGAAGSGARPTSSRRADGGEGSSADGGDGSSASPPAEHPRAWAVNWILFASSVAYSVGSGATVKYFPLFFKEDLQLSPVAVQLIFVLMPAANAAFSSLGLRMSRRIGRVQTMLVLRASSIVLLIVIGAFSMYLRSGRQLQAMSEWARRIVIGIVVVIYLVRSALANCTTPISTSISMDFVPSGQRARWSSLGSIAQACWSGSAAVGGVLADRYGYAFVFMLTAAFHAAGTIAQAALLPIVPKRE